MTLQSLQVDFAGAGDECLDLAPHMEGPQAPLVVVDWSVPSSCLRHHGNQTIRAFSGYMRIGRTIHRKRSLGNVP